MWRVTLDQGGALLGNLAATGVQVPGPVQLLIASLALFVVAAARRRAWPQVVRQRATHVPSATKRPRLLAMLGTYANQANTS